MSEPTHDQQRTSDNVELSGQPRELTREEELTLPIGELAKYKSLFDVDWDARFEHAIRDAMAQHEQNKHIERKPTPIRALMIAECMSPQEIAEGLFRLVGLGGSRAVRDALKQLLRQYARCSSHQYEQFDNSEYVKPLTSPFEYVDKIERNPNDVQLHEIFPATERTEDGCKVELWPKADQQLSSDLF